MTFQRLLLLGLVLGLIGLVWRKSHGGLGRAELLPAPAGAVMETGQ